MLGVGILLAAAPALAPLADAGQDDERPAGWASESHASSVLVSANPVPTPFVAEVVRAEVPQGASGWNAGGQSTAIASVYYPGVGVTGAGGLVCTLAPCPPGIPPPFPFVAAAQHPATPDASITTGQRIAVSGVPAEAEGGRAVAHAGLDHTSTDAVVGGFRLAGTDATAAGVLRFRRSAATTLRGPMAAAAVAPTASDTDLIRVDTLRARTRQSFERGVLVSVAESTLEGIHLLGGTIVIDAMVTTSVARVGPQRADSDARTVMSGVTVSGQPARVDEHGVSVGSGEPQAATVASTLNDALADLLKETSTEIVALSSDETAGGDANGRSSQSDAGGLLVRTLVADARVPGPVNAVAAAVQLGRTGAVASTSPAATSTDVDALAETLLGESTGGFGAPTDDAGGVAGPPAARPAASTGPGPAGPPAAPGPASAAPAAMAPAAVSDTVVDRIKQLYLVMTATCLALGAGAHHLWPALRRSR